MTTNLIFLAHQLFSSFYILVASVEAQKCTLEVVEGGSSDDDGQIVNFKRASNGESSRKRRVVLDYSDEDEYEDAVSLASPDIPKVQSSQDQKQNTKVLVSEKSNLNFDKKIEDKLKVKEEMVTGNESNQPLSEDYPAISKGTNTGTSSTDKVQSHIPESDVNKKDKLTIAAPKSPKRRKVLKTRIDERGREGIHTLRCLRFQGDLFVYIICRGSDCFSFGNSLPNSTLIKSRYLSHSN